jgi:hypothetical protein
VTALRRLAFPFWLARARLARRRERFALVVLGLGAAAAMLGAVLAGTVAAQDREVGRSMSALPDTVRAVRVNWFSVGGQVAPYAQLDAHVRSVLEQVSDVRPTGTSLYRESQLGGALLSLGAVDRLGRWVRLRSGRLPRRCEPQRCEVIVIRHGGRIPNVPGLRLVPVGEGDLRSATLFGDAVPAETLRQSAFVRKIIRYHRSAPPPLVLANGVAGLDRSQRLHDAYRSYGWVVPLERGTVRSWSVDHLADRIEHARSALQAETFGFEVTAPTDELRAASDAAKVSGRRLLLLGGEAVALLLAFAVLAAARLRPDVDASRRRLLSSGTRRWQVGLLVVAESAAMALCGALVGWIAGSAVATAVAGRTGEPVAALLRHSVLSGGGIALALILAGAAALVLAVALTVRPVAVRGHSLSPLDVAALGAAVTVAVALGRGAADTTDLLAGNGTGIVLLLLPSLVGFAAAVAAARLLPAGLRLLERAVPRDALAFRLATLGLARRPGYAAVAVGFVVVSIGLALFAETYRSTLVRGQKEQVAYAVPADAVVQEDLSQLVPVRSVLTPPVVRSLRPDAHVEPVIRLAGNIQGAADVTGISVVGMSGPALRRIDGWRGDFSASPPPELAERLAPSGPVALRSEPLPPRATRLELPIAVSGTEVGVAASIRSRDGSFTTVELGRTVGPRPQLLTAPIPRSLRGGSLVSLRFEPPAKLEERGADAGAPAVGSVTLGYPRAGGKVVTDYSGWTGTAGASRLDAADRLRFGLTLTNEVDTYVRPRQPTDGLRIPAVVSPRLATIAGPDRVLGVDVAGQPLVFRVAAVAKRFPGGAPPGTDDFMVADRATLQTALNASAPGAGFPTEAWVNAEPGRRAALEARLRKQPFPLLAVSSQAALERSLKREPVSRAALAMLEASALIAVLLALLALVLGAVSERRDEAAESFDLEAQGTPPARLRRQLRLRALVVAGAGIVGGLVTGIVLSLLVVSFVELTANATAPVPPLALSLDWTAVAVSALVAVALGALLVGLVTGRAFREPAPARYGGGG